MRFARTGSLAIEIEDDGHGLTPDAKAGVGLAAMRERVERVLTIAAAPSAFREPLV